MPIITTSVCALLPPTVNQQNANYRIVDLKDSLSFIKWKKGCFIGLYITAAQIQILEVALEMNKYVSKYKNS